MDEVLAYSRPLFNGADSDRDGQLTLREYVAFMHPELHLHMIDILVDSFLEQFDNNDDGYVSFYEYMGKSHCVHVIELSLKFRTRGKCSKCTWVQYYS